MEPFPRPARPVHLAPDADDTLAVLADAGVNDYVLVGHSMGGKVAQLVAATRPAGFRGLILVGSAPIRPAAKITPEYQEQISHAYDSDESTAATRDHVLTSTALSDEVKARIATDSRASADGARTEWPIRGIAEDVSEYTQMVNVPALVVAGENDHVDPAEELRLHLIPYLSDVAFVLIPKTGHLIPLEAPAELSHALSAFSKAE